MKTKLFIVAAFSILFVISACVPAFSAGDIDLKKDDYSFSANVKTPDQFEAWKNKILYFHRKALRVHPDYKAIPLEVEYISEERIDDEITLYKITYATTDGLRIPAFLLVPDSAEKVPAVIVYHGHGDGKVNTVYGEGTNENALALYLAKNLGYVVLAPDARTFGEFSVNGKKAHYDYYLGLIFKSKLYMSKLMEDGYQDLALLAGLEKADMEHLGAAGISMGSWRTLNFTAMHEQVDAAVVAGLFIPWKYLMSEAHCRCQHIPKLAEKMGMADLAATVFPRKLLIQWGLDDKYHKQDAEELIEKTQAIADFIGHPESFSVDRREGMGHRFSNKEIAEFFLNELGPGAWEPRME